jgi:protein-tyrosine phosphatase
MVPKLYAVPGPWRGGLLLSSRPRGGDWLEDEVTAWQRHGVDSVVSLLTEDEERELDLLSEGLEARRHHLAFASYPIPDRGLPADTSTFVNLLERIEGDLNDGKNVLVHCRPGIGRTGLIAACLLVRNGMEPERAMERVSAIRGVRVPETPEQEGWIYGLAANVR